MRTNAFDSVLYNKINILLECFIDKFQRVKFNDTNVSRYLIRAVQKVSLDSGPNLWQNIELGRCDGDFSWFVTSQNNNPEGNL